MKSKKIKKTFEIEADEETMERFERFLALLHYNSRFGHSSCFAMELDGDGWGKFTASPINKEYKNDVDLIGGVGGSAEVASNGRYVAKKIEALGAYYQAKNGKLYRNEKVIKEITND